MSAIVSLFLALVVLSGFGMPLRMPCCGPTEMAAMQDPADARGCCPFPDCCREEKRGAAPATVSARALSAPAPSVTTIPSTVTVAIELPLPRSEPSVVSRSHSPPRPPALQQAILATFRV